MTVQELVSAGLVAGRGILARPTAGDRARVDEAIERVGLSEQCRRMVSRLSGGQQQRAFVAKALAAAPELLVLDEPTAGVDVDAQESLAHLLGELHRDLKVTILLVSHEFGAVEAARRPAHARPRRRSSSTAARARLPPTWHDPSHAHV